jgi:eukaryotic-like serine/threonine-protein kinase
MLPFAAAIVAGVATVAILASVFGRKTPPALPPAPAGVADAGPAAVALAGADAATSVADAGSGASDAGTGPAQDAGLPLGASGPDEQTALELVIEPPVDASVDGNPAARTPFTVSVPAGKHRIQVSDKRLGVNLVRTVTVAPKGKTREEIHLGRGFVTVSAPEGAVIFIDGRNMGKAPLHGELTLYEGAHQIVVTVGKAKWQQAFSVRASEHAYFNVEAQ